MLPARLQPDLLLTNVWHCFIIIFTLKIARLGAETAAGTAGTDHVRVLRRAQAGGQGYSAGVPEMTSATMQAASQKYISR